MESFVQQSDSQFHILTWTERWPWLSAGVTSRLGGSSKPPFLTANYALHVGDQDEIVIENRKNLCTSIAVPFEAWTSAEQVHSANIHHVGIDDRGKGRLDRNDAIQATDGLVTDLKGVLLTTFYADCVPLYFVDPVKKVIGMAHAGWKGTVQQIGPKMVQRFVQRYDSDIKDIHAAIGPAIGGCCYEVNDHVADQIHALPINISEHMLHAVTDKKGHYDLDLKAVNHALLANEGIASSRILVSDWCTKCDNNFFYSFRNESGNTGRHCAWLVMREE